MHTYLLTYILLYAVDLTFILGTTMNFRPLISKCNNAKQCITFTWLNFY